MRLLHILALISTFQSVHLARDSLVQLKNNGYEDIIIAVNPEVPEDGKIIEQIKKMLTDASSYLFQATKKRIYIRSAKILIPNSWTSNSSYGRPKLESYDKADVIVASPFIHGDDPYTLQFGGCGEKGKYIHFTPNFLVNDEKMLPIYGPRGRVFVHEWAHLRWGVFDEYNYNRPYYLSENRKVEATRCPLKMQGSNLIEVCQRGICNLEACEYDENTGLYEEDCKFYPKMDSNVEESVMYAQMMEPVHAFCNSSSHNSEAPNQQNRLCSQQSTWDVISKSSDIQSSPPLMDSNIPAPVVSLLQYKDRVVSLVLDISGSMANANRITRLYQASEVYIMQIVEQGAYVGIVVFSTGAEVKSPLVKITDTFQRESLKLKLPTAATGGTNICAGVRQGLEVNKNLDQSTHGTEIVLLTDGEDSGISGCFPEVIKSGAIIHTIALGNNADAGLEKLAELTGGLKLYASDKVDANGLIDSFSGIVSNTGNVTQQSLQIESSATQVKPNGCLDGKVVIDKTVGNDTFFLVTWDSTIPSISLTDPIGKVYTETDFKSDQVSKSARLLIPGTAQIGTWQYRLCSTVLIDQVIGITVNSRAANENVPPIVAEAYMNDDSSTYPKPMIVYAIVTQGLAPVLGATVTAVIEPQNGNVQTLQLLDNGAGADIIKNDGIYSKYFVQFSGNGRYNLKVRVESKEKTPNLSAPASRALYLPGYIVNGTVFRNPPRPKDTVIEDQSLGNFTRTVSGGAFTVTNVPSGPLPDNFKPEKITDLEATIKGKEVEVTWTATGDDLDQGNASVYDLRMSLSSKDLLENFENATTVNVTHLAPQLAGTRENFTFTPENVVIQNGTIIFFALIAFDDAGLKSDTSNLAKATFFVPQKNPGNGSNHSNFNKLTFILVGLMVMLTLVINSAVSDISC
ncbi:calcium-activated chloride channel regulator 1 [Xenopus laevis]|uniref:Calcium-activated Chloride channel regulator 1 n=2 Tax=Xenopus laevis TaxID=8355 RepID=A0A1L8GMY0_XENLA|nr:calcium-activated chloride channel regulator 1 [Xenopus laevis]XP_018114089.1 calcium-activated chloride channel regulator 1 [Xenopus laevis]OCT85202.1 hypothetical protein XELAEV_18023366mg [Xenopus laevis]